MNTGGSLPLYRRTRDYYSLARERATFAVPPPPPQKQIVAHFKVQRRVPRVSSGSQRDDPSAASVLSFRSPSAGDRRSRFSLFRSAAQTRAHFSALRRKKKTPQLPSHNTRRLDLSAVFVFAVIDERRENNKRNGCPQRATLSSSLLLPVSWL